MWSTSQGVRVDESQSESMGSENINEQFKVGGRRVIFTHPGIWAGMWEDGKGFSACSVVTLQMQEQSKEGSARQSEDNLAGTSAEDENVRIASTMRFWWVEEASRSECGRLEV